MRGSLRAFGRFRRSVTIVVAALALLGLGAAGGALAVGGAPPPPISTQSLAERLVQAKPPEAASGRFEFANRLLPSSVTDGQRGGDAPSPFLTGGSGRFWYSSPDRLRIELDGAGGKVQLVRRGRTLWLHDPARRVAHRVKLPPRGAPAGEQAADVQGCPPLPSSSTIAQALAALGSDFALASPVSAVVAGRSAYEVRGDIRDSGGLLAAVGSALDAGALDAATLLPLRFELIAREVAEPVLSLQVSEVSLDPVSPSLFTFDPPAGTAVTTTAVPQLKQRGRPDFDVAAPARLARRFLSERRTSPSGVLSVYGAGAGKIHVFESEATGPARARNRSLLALPTVRLAGERARVLGTRLGSVVYWRSGRVSFVVAASRPAAEVTRAARAVAEAAR